MRKIKIPQIHLILLHMSALLFGGTALFSKILPFSANDIILSRSLFSSIILGFFLLIISSSKLKILSLKDGAFIILSGLFFGIHLFTYFYAIQVSSIGIGVISLFTFPMITTLLEPVILKKSPKLKDILLGLMVLLGVFFIVSDSTIASNSLYGVGLGILSAFTYSLRNLIQKYRLINYSPLSMLFYQMVITLFLMMPFSTLNYSEISNNDLTLLLILSIVFTIVPHLAVIESLKKFDARAVSIILTLQVFYAIVFAYLVFKEEIKTSIVFGASIILFVVIYESLRIRFKLKNTNK